VVGSPIFMVETEPGSSSKTCVSTILHIPKDENLELKDAVQFSAAYMGQRTPI